VAFKRSGDSLNLSLRKLEYLWHVLAFVLLMGAFVPLWRQATLDLGAPGEGDPVQRLFLGVAYMGVGLLLFHPRRALLSARHGLLVWALVGWALLSTSWSVAPEITLRRGIGALLGALYGLLLAVRYSPKEVLRMLGVALAVVVVASLVAVVVTPDWAVMGPRTGRAWQGVMFHKNALGRTSALALMVFWTLSRAEQGSSGTLWRLLMLMAGVAVLGCRSTTGLILAVAGPGAWWALRAWNLLPRLLRPAAGSFAFALAIPVVMVLPDLLEAGVGVLGKDLTLTGRIPLWLLLIPLALQRPLLGYGYGAFWLGESGPSATVWALTWDAPHAHNGYLDLWLQTGLVGALMGVAILASLLVRYAKRVAIMSKAPMAELGFLAAVYMFLGDLSGTTLLQSGLGKALYWVIVAYLYLNRTDYNLPRSRNMMPAVTIR
jgi:O-antigen ligase